MSSDFGKAVRRFNTKQPLQRRTDDHLEFADAVKELPARLLLDTTVYIDTLQDRLPTSAGTLLMTTTLYHSTVTGAELAATCGILDPAHPKTPLVIKAICQTIDQRPSHRLLVPDDDIWLKAGLACGALARVQGYGASERKRVLNDCLIFFTAAKHGCALLTGNIGDFDLLMQMNGFGGVIFYRRT